MARTRRARPELTESWDSVNSHDDFDEDIYNPEDERSELASSYYSDDRPSRSRNIPTPATNDDDNDADVSLEASRNALQNSRTSKEDMEARDYISPRKRGARSSVDSSLVMPASPNGGANGSPARTRAHTPHFRLNQRSLTSDAGDFNRRASNRGSASARGGKTEAEYDEEIDNTSDLNWPFVLWEKVAGPVAMYALDILHIAVNNPITKSLLAVWLLVGVFIVGTNLVNDTVSNALSPICRIPGTSYLHLPFCPTQMAPEITGPAEFDKLVEAQSQFEEVLSVTAQGGFLPMDMKKSEASVRDLKHIVQYSNLPSRNELVFEFAGFIDTARQASHDLSKFNSRIGRAVDHILSTNRWTLNIIEGVAEKDAAQGTLVKWFSNNLNIFAPFQPIALSRDVLLDRYLRHTGAVEEQILSLISEAQALITVLDNLDSRLDLIANVATRDGISVKESKEELFATLFAKLGGRRGSAKKLDAQLALLKQVGKYRSMAWAHVTGAMIKLTAIRHSLEDLRERVAMPDVIGDKVPLEVHIANINLGIQRLEEQRDKGRQLEREQYARITAKGEEFDRGIEGREL